MKTKLPFDEIDRGELIAAARAVGATSQNENFWKQVEARMDVRDGVKKNLVKPRNLTNPLKISTV
jgi:hypothetical protein